MKNPVQWLKSIFELPKLGVQDPRLKGRGFQFDNDLVYDERNESYEQYRKRVRKRQEEHNRDNEVEVQIANYHIQKEALQKTLIIAYGSMITSAFAVIVALLAVVVSFVTNVRK